MPEPILPAISFTIAAIGCLATVRNGIDLIIRDKDRVKDFVVQDIVLISINISLLANRLERWKHLWCFHDGVSEDILVSFWDTSGLAHILKILATAELQSKAIVEEFETRYELFLSKPQQAFETQGCISERRRGNRLQKLLKEYNMKYGAARRVKLALFDSPTFRRHLESLESTVTGLESLAISVYQKKHKCAYDEGAAKKLSLQAILLDFAKRAGDGFADVISQCKAQMLPATHSINIQTNIAYGSGDISRDQYIIQRSGRSGFPFYLKLIEGSNDGHKHSQFVFDQGTAYAELTDFLRPRYDPGLSEDASERQVQDTRSLREANSIECLREVLSTCSQGSGLIGSRFHRFSLSERYKVLYELSETVLVLLATTSLGGLCSCAIQRYCPDPAKNRYEHYLRLNNIHAARSGDHSEGLVSNSRIHKWMFEKIGSFFVRLKSWISSPGDVRWCTKTELMNMHLCRLGIVLTEISTGAVMRDVRYDENSREVVVSLDRDYRSGLLGYMKRFMELIVARTHRNCSIDIIAERVTAAAGVDMGFAVNYCLRGSHSTDDLAEQDLKRFFNQVIAPLYLHYQAHGLEPQMVEFGS